MIYSALNCFNAGELSPKLLARPELDAYGRGCQTLENFLPTPYGSVERRPGTEVFVTEIAKGSRIIPFVFNDDNSYLCVIATSGVVKLYRFTQAATEVYNVAAPFVTDDDSDSESGSGSGSGGSFDPWKLDFVQSADVVFFAHPGIWPKKLSRTVSGGTVAFVLEDMAFDYPPAKDQDTSGVKLKCSATAPGTTGATLTASDDLFDSTCVGQRYLILQRNNQNEERNIAKSDSGGSRTIQWVRVKGAYTITTHGTWTGDITISRRYSGETPSGSPGSDEVIAVYESVNDFNVSLSGDETEDDAWYYVSWACSVTKSKCYVTLSNPGFEMTGVVKVTAVTSSTVATCDIERRLYQANKFSSEWRESAFSPKNGYPQAIALFQERLFYAGTSENRERIWGSATNDWLDYEVIGQEDGSAIDLTLSSDTVARVCWIQAKDRLLIGTTEDEWSVGSASNGTALTAANLDVRRNSTYGSAYPCRCLMAQDRIIFVQKDRKHVRSFQYSWEQDSYACEDIGLLAEHVFDGMVKDIALQKSPDTILWVLMQDGTVATATIDMSQQVTAWERVVTLPSFGSVCVLPNPSGDDFVYAMEERAGWTYASLCRFFSRDYAGVLPQTFLDMAFRLEPDQDIRIPGHGSPDCHAPIPICSQTFRGFSLSYDTIAGMTVAEAENMCIFTDDGRCYPLKGHYDEDHDDFIFVVAEIFGGWLGYSYTSTLSPMPTEQQLQNGLSLLHPKTVNRLRVDFYDTRGGKVRCNGGPWTRNPAHASSDAVDELPLHSNILVASPMGGHAERIKVEVVQDEPWPMNVASISQTVSVEGM